MITRILCALPCLVCPSLVLAQSAARPVSVAVSSLALQDVGPWGSAALPAGINPLSSDLWRGSDPGTLSVAFSRLSPDQRFPSLQVLVRQAIFSGGAAPTTDMEVSRTRFEAANRFGPSEAAARLIFGVPQLSRDGGLVNLAIDAGLRAGRRDEACGLIEAVPIPLQGIAWLESRATCYALNNEPDAANLSVDLAKSRGQTDTWLSRAIAAVGAPVTAPPPFRTDSGRALALSLQAKLKPPTNFLASIDASGLSTVVGNAGFIEALPAEERTQYLTAAAARGAAPIQIASRPLMTAPVAPVLVNPGNAPTIEAPAQPLPELPTIPAQLTARILSAPTLQARSLEGRLSIEALRAVMASQPGLLTLADVPVMTEAALWAGDGALASAIAALSPTPLETRLGLVLALYDQSKQPLFIEQMLDASSTDTVARRLVLRDAALAWSAGMPIGGGASNLILQGLPTGQSGNAAMRLALDLAAGRGSKGEVALLVGLALQAEEPASASPETVITSVRALRRVGLESTARDLARDYLLANYVTLATPRAIVRPRTTAAPAPRPQTSPAARPPPPRPPRPNAAPTTTTPPANRPAAARAPAPRAAPRTKPSWGTP